MNIIVFDTETTGLEKPFCYNIGYVVYDTTTDTILTKADFVVEQIWHNLPLFSTAYYANKREIYVSAMRGKQTVMSKYGLICQKMRRDIIKYEVECAYAYNSSFDDRVYKFNCDWFKCVNPFDNIPIYDIRGNTHEFIADNYYKAFCIQHNLFTEQGNYSTTAESVYKYISNNPEFIEDHTALSDALIELEILKYSVCKGAKYGVSYESRKSIKRIVDGTFTVKVGDEKYEFPYTSKRYVKAKDTMYLYNEEDEE